MNTDMPTRILTCSPSLQWVKDSTQVLIVDDQENRITVLEGIESSVWDWMMLGYKSSDLITFLAVLCDETKSLAETRLAGILQGWIKTGLVGWQEEKHG
jgi:hypothetical protein